MGLTRRGSCGSRWTGWGAVVVCLLNCLGWMVLVLEYLGWMDEVMDDGRDDRSYLQAMSDE